MNTRPAHADDLEAARQTCFTMLGRGVADRRCAFHTPTLASIGTDGAPKLRTLVLRGFEPATRTLRLHTDARAGKCAEIVAEPRTALHFYDVGQRMQLRLDCRATLHHDDAVAEAGWQASRDFSRMCYAIEPGPGTPIASPPPAPTDAEAGRLHFAVLLLEFHAMEWLWLAAEGHRRARFTWGEAQAAEWLVP